MARQAMTAAANARARALRSTKTVSQQELLLENPAIVELDETPCAAAPVTPVKRRVLEREVSDVKMTEKRQRLGQASADAAKLPAALACPMAASPSDEVYPLVGREDECRTLDGFFEEALSGARASGCVYVYGAPGTGKTYSVRAAASRWRQRFPATQVLEVNCMRLGQRTPTAMLLELGDRAQALLGCAAARPLPRTGTRNALVVAVAERLAKLAPSVIIIADEVDQLVSRRHGAPGLEAVFEIARAAGAPAVGFVAIANHVDLLERSAGQLTGLCESLLFQPYNAVQLRNIVKARFEAAGAAGVAAAKALGPVQLEIGVRQVAKRSGDCRQIIQLCEQAFMDAAAKAAAAEEPAQAASDMMTPRRPGRSGGSKGDPLAMLGLLLPDLQVLLCAMSAGKAEAMKLTDVRSRYNLMAKKLHQEAATSDEVSAWVSMLEQKGLLTVRAAKAARGRGGSVDSTVELAVSCKALRDGVAKANPMLGQCLA